MCFPDYLSFHICISCFLHWDGNTVLMCNIAYWVTERKQWFEFGKLLGEKGIEVMLALIGLFVPAIIAAIIWCRFKDEKLSHRCGYVMLACYAMVLFLLQAVRLGDYNYWGDECYSIMLSKMSYADMLNATAMDVHPPLYYILLKLVCAVVGNNYIAYNLTTMIPFAILLLLAVTIVRKKFGWECSVILITLASLLDSSIQYNAEVRMYSWGLLFVFLSFILLYKILHENKNGNFVWFTLASLCAAYTHYYCLIIVAFYYLTLLVLAVVHPKKYMKPVLFTCAGTVAGYLPWLVVLLKTLMRTAESFWLEEYLTLGESLAYLFSGKFEYLLLWIFLVLTAVYVLRELGIVAVTSENGKRGLRFGFTNLTMSMEAVWVLTGLCSILGTIVIGMVVSRLIRPVLLLRYLYPAAVVAWLVMGFVISKLKWKQVYAGILTALVILSGCFQYKNVITQEREVFQLLQSTLQATSGRISAEDQILTTQNHIAWTISQFYYPDVLCMEVEMNSTLELEDGITYWLITSAYDTETGVSKLEAQNLAYEEVVVEGNLGTHYVNIYKIVK